jgi:hypothetical protein
MLQQKMEATEIQYNTIKVENRSFSLQSRIRMGGALTPFPYVLMAW